MTPRSLCVSGAPVERVAIPLLRARKLFQVSKSSISHIFLSPVALVASADAALALAESGVCKPQGRICGGLVRAQAKPSHGKQTVLAARRRGSAPKQRPRRAVLETEAPAGASA